MKELALNILDIVQNSIGAKADQEEIFIEESRLENSMRIVISDNGSGMRSEILKDVTDPFITSRTTRKVGLGLPFLKQHAEMAGGRLKIESHVGVGTNVEAAFILNHIDRQPMGDISGVIKLLIIANPRIDFLYKHKTDTGEFSLDTREIKHVFEVNDLSDNNLMNDIKSMIKENLSSIDIAE